MKEIALTSLFDKFAQIEAFIFDVDGVFTNGQLLVTESGELLRSMNVRDGQAVKYALDCDYPIGIITGGSSQGVLKRFHGLGIEDVYYGKSDKLPSFYDFLGKHHLDPRNVLYMGDDIPDVPLMKKVGLAACPQDACPEASAAADYIAVANGGAGCVREVLEKSMRIQMKWRQV